ncbi:MAG TPA: biotin/lipoyl-containing protein, partial [Methylovirgula sp.]
MTVEIRVPTLGESVSEATIGRWYKQAGDPVSLDEPIVELETDKVTVEVNAPATGVLSEIAAKDGTTVAPGALLGAIAEGAAAAKSAKPAKAPPAAANAAPANDAKGARPPSPAAAKVAADQHLDLAAIQGTGKQAQVLKGDVLAFASAQPAAIPAPTQARAPSSAPDAAREERVRMTKLRQTIARRLKEAQATAA